MRCRSSKSAFADASNPYLFARSRTRGRCPDSFPIWKPRRPEPAHPVVVRTDLNNHSEKCPCNGTCFLEPYYLSARLICDRTETINRAEAPSKENEHVRQIHFRTVCCSGPRRDGAGPHSRFRPRCRW